MKKSYLFTSTLIAASFALAVPAWATGDGTAQSPYSESVGGLDLGTFSEGSTIYINGITSGYFGTSSQNISFTCVADVNIGSGGMTLNNGYSSGTYTFTGNITGDGTWAFDNSENDPTQYYIFTGSLAGYSGNIDYSKTHANGYIHYGNGGKAATDTNVTGTGSVTHAGTIVFNYSDYASNESTAITIGNSSISATTVEFAGSVNYAVSNALTGFNNSGTLIISNVGHTTTLNGATSGFTTVTINDGATLAVGSTGSLNLSGTTVNIGSTIQNSGTVILDTSTSFVIDGFGVEFEGDWSTGATYTLITNVGTGSVTISGTLDINNVSSATSNITSATFNYDGSSLTLTVTGTFVLSNGLHGDGQTASSAYISAGGSSGNILTIGLDASLFTGKGTTVYLATDDYALGSAYENIYWSTSVTAECDIVIGAAGIYLTNGSGGNVHTFSGKISGEGSWTVTSYSGGGGTVRQHYAFTGDLSEWNGNFTITTSNADDYVAFGGTISLDKDNAVSSVTGTQAATNTSVSGNGAISVDYGTVHYAYATGAEGSTEETLTVTNTSIEAHTIIFGGGVNYNVSADLRGWDGAGASNGDSSTNSTLEISTAGTVTVSGSISNFDNVTVAKGSTLTLSGEVSLSDAIQNSGTVVVTSSVTFDLANLTADGDVYTFISGDGTITNWNSDTLTSDNFTLDGWDLGRSYITIGETAGQATLTTVAAESLTWAGTDGATWSNQGGTWDGEETFYNRDSVTFGSHTSSGETSQTVNITGSLLAGTITVNDNYTFALADKVTLEADHIYVSSNEKLTLTMANSGTATVHMDGESFVDLLTGADGYGTLDIGTGVTLYLSDYNNGGYTIDASNAHGSITGTGTLSLGSNGELGLYLPSFAGTVEIRSGTLRFGYQNSYETGVFNESATLQFDSGVGLTLVGNTTNAVSAALVFKAGSHTIATNGHAAEFSGTIDGANADISITGKGNLTFSGSSISFGSLSLSTAGSTISVGKGSVLNVTNGITYSTGDAANTASKITGASADTSTVITGSLQIGSGNGASVQISDVTFITGGISYGNNNNLNFYLFFKDATLGFTESTTISPASSGGYGFMLGEFSGFSTTSDASTTTINTSKYDTTKYAFSDTEGVNVTIAANITGTDATLVVEGNGSLTLSGTTTVDALKLSSGSLDIAGTTSVSSGLTVSGGTLSVTETGSLDLTGTVTINNAIVNSGTITIAEGTSITVGVEVQTGDYNGTNYDYYELITGSGSGSVELTGNVTFVIGGDSVTLDGIISPLADGDTDWKGYIYGGSLYIYAETSTTAQTADNLTWAGTDGNNTWDADNSSNAIWNDTDSGDSGYYFTSGNNVTFGPNTEGSLSTTIVLGENITAGTVNITGSGYTLTAGAGSTLTATSIVLDDEDNADTHTFTIASGVTVKAESMTETAGQLDLVINGELEVTTMTVSTTEQDESISGSGKLTVEAFEYSSGHGVSLTISVTEATFGSIIEQAPGGNESSGSLRHLIFGDGTNTTTATVTSMEIKGLSEVQVAKDSTLTITELVDSSGWNTTISGDGSIKIGSLNVTGNSTSGSTLTISVANFEADSASFSGTNNVSISSANAVIGMIQSDATHTITIEEGGNLTAGEIYRSNNTLNLAVDGTLTVTQLESYTGSTGMIYFGKSGSSTTMAQTISGSGTVNAYGIEAYFGDGSTNHLTISVANLNIGEGGITESTGSRLYINGTTIGLYEATNVTIAANMVIDSAGAAFNMKSGETITLSGTVTGNGLVTKEGAGELAFTGTGSTLKNGLTVSAGTVSVATGASLTLGGTVTLASAISNSGTITIDSSTSFVINGIGMGNNGSRDYYVLITGGDGASLNGTISIDNFSGGNIDSSSWSVWSEGLSNGYLVIYGEAQAEVSDLTWAGTSNNYTWDTKSENTNWTNDATEDSVAFTTGSNVTFDDTAANKSVVLGDNIDAGSITVTGTGYELSGEYKLTGTELILADTDSDSGEHTFTIAEGTTVEVGGFTENVGQMNLVVNGDLEVDGDMHVDASADEVISGSGTFHVRNFTYDAAQGSSLTISVADASFVNLYEQPSSESDDSNGKYRTLIIGSADGVIPADAEYSTEVSGGYAEISGKSEVRVNKNSMFAANSIHNYSDYDLLISGEGLFYANEFDLAGKGKLIISCAEVEAGVVYNSKENIVINEGGQLAVGDFKHTTIVEEENEGEVSYTEGLLNLQVDGTFIVDILDDYVDPKGTLSFGTENSDTELTGSHSISGKGTANIYKLEYGADGAGLTISVANLNIGEGGISAAEGASSLVLDGVIVGVYAGLEEDNTSWSTDANLTLKNGVTFNTKAGESITLAGVVETDSNTEGSSLTKTGEGTLTLAGEATLSGLTVSGGTLSVDTGASLTLAGNDEVDIQLDGGMLAIAKDATVSSGADVKTSVTISNGGQLSLGDSVSLNVDVMNIVLCEANYDASGTGSGTFAIVGDTGSSLTLTDDATITITVSEAIATLLSEEGTYSFDIYSGLSLDENVFDISDILSYAGVYEATWNQGVLTVFVGAIPEPELFSVFFGLGAIGLVATRRRRRKVA